MRQEAGTLDQCTDPGQYGSAGFEPVAVDVHLASGGADQSHEDAQGRGLAGAVRAEHAHHLVEVDGEVHCGHRDEAVGVLLAQPAHDQRDVGVLGDHRALPAPAQTPGDHHRDEEPDGEDGHQRAEDVPPHDVGRHDRCAGNGWQAHGRGTRVQPDGVDGRLDRRGVRLVGRGHR